MLPLCLLGAEGQQEGQDLPRILICPRRFHQVSVNPAYQAMELEYVLKKVQLISRGGAWHRGLHRVCLSESDSVS